MAKKSDIGKSNSNWEKRDSKGKENRGQHPWRGSDNFVKDKIRKIWTDVTTPENASIEKYR